MDLAKLKAPFKPSHVSWRVGSTNADKSKGMALCYVDARDVQDRLDEACGMGGWQCRYVPMHDKKTVCEIGVWIEAPGPNHPGEWVWKSDGAGDSDVEAEKGALSDAFKRAAVRWGIGRYLYDLDSPWVAVEPAGRSFKIAAHEYARLEGILAKSAPKPSGGTPQSAAPPKPEQYEEDPAGQVKAWCDKEMGKWTTMTRLPDLLMWQDEREPELHRLQKKAPKAHRVLMDAFARKQTELGKVA